MEGDGFGGKERRVARPPVPVNAVGLIGGAGALALEPKRAGAGRGHSGVFREVQKLRHGFLAEIDEREIDGADGREAKGAVQGVVETADGEIPGSTQAGFPQKHDDPRGLHVAQAGDVGDLAAPQGPDDGLEKASTVVLRRIGVQNASLHFFQGASSFHRFLNEVKQ